MNRLRSVLVIPVLLSLGLSSVNARADGGVVRLRDVQGPFIVTIFTASEVAANCPSDVSVMVQRRDSSEAILDAKVDLFFTISAALVVEPTEEICGQSGAAPLESHVSRYTVSATHEQASNKLLYAARIKFSNAGDWRLQAFVERGKDAVTFACNIPVALPPHGVTGLQLYLVLPPLMVSLFAMNHSLRKRPQLKNSEAETKPALAIS
jgi:hypothetical protein